MVTVQITLIISTAMPRPNEVRQTTGSGSSSAIDSGETAIAPPISATNRMGPRGAQLRPRDRRAERLETAVPGGQHHRVLEHDRPQPGVRAELRPALAQLPEHAGRLPALPRGPPGPDRQHQRHRAEHPGPAGQQRPAGAEQRHALPGQRRPGHRRRVHAQPADRARLLHLVGPHQGRQQRRRRGVEQGHAGAGHQLQADHDRHGRVSGQDEQAERAFAEGEQQVRRDDHPRRGDPVRDHPADQQEDQRRGDLGGQQAVGEQKAEVAVGQDREAARERAREHGGSNLGVRAAWRSYPGRSALPKRFCGGPPGCRRGRPVESPCGPGRRPGRRRPGRPCGAAPGGDGRRRMSILGTRVLRTEDPKFLTTGGVYTADLADDRLAGACHVFFVRSPLAHARIRQVDVSAALAAPGVVAAFTGADLAGLPPVAPLMPALVNQAMTRPLLAAEKVRFVGDPVAVVVTEHPHQGEDAAELVDVDYEPLPPVVDLDAALSDEVLLFEKAGTNVVAEFGSEASLRDDLFDGCEVVVSRTFVNQRVAPAPMEARAAAAAWGQDGRLTIWTPNQGAQSTREELAQMLGVEQAAIRVITTDVGGAFGAKFGADPEHAVVAWVARRLGRPARWAETRSENLIAMTHGRAQRHAVTIGGSRDGDVQAYRLRIVQDAGAYPRIGAVLPFLTIMMATGPYDIPSAEAVGVTVATTTTPVGAFRGAGRPEATAALERAFDLFAAEIGADPAQVRRRNLLPPFTEPHRTAFGARYDSGNYAAALERALEAAGYRELRAEQARRRERGDVVQLGIGISCYVEITGGGDGGEPHENAVVEAHPDGTATILTGTSPHGQGHATAWAMIASDELGIPVDKITVLWGDTDLIPEGGGTGGSRSLQQGGAAVQQASRELISLARERAAAALEASPGDLVFNAGRSAFEVAGDPEASVPLADLAAQERLVARAVFTAPDATYPFGAHVAVAEVDTQTGQAALRRMVTVDDAGTVLNPLLAEGQRHGGIAQGAAQALLEEVVYDAHGNPLTASFADYPIVTAAELPSFELADMATPTS